MMEKKYQLVAWTANVTDQRNARLYMIPSLHHEMQEPYITGISRCYKELEQRSGSLSLYLASRFVKFFEQNARFMFLTGYYGDGLRYLCKAALYCVREDHSQFCGKLRHEFIRLSEEAIAIARKYSLEEIFLEKDPEQMMDFYLEYKSKNYNTCVFYDRERKNAFRNDLFGSRSGTAG